MPESPNSIHPTAAMTGSASGTGEQAGNLSHCSVNQVMLEIMDEIRMLKLECLLKGLVNAGESNPKFGFQPILINPATSRVILIR